MDMKPLLTDRGVLIVTFPNDFSDIQKLSVDLEKNNEYWVASPDHISYFNKDSFQNLAESLGFKVVLLFAEFPIEIRDLRAEIESIGNTDEPFDEYGF